MRNLRLVFLVNDYELDVDVKSNCIARRHSLLSISKYRALVLRSIVGILHKWSTVQNRKAGVSVSWNFVLTSSALAGSNRPLNEWYDVDKDSIDRLKNYLVSMAGGCHCVDRAVSKLKNGEFLEPSIPFNWRLLCTTLRNCLTNCLWTDITPFSPGARSLTTESERSEGCHKVALKDIGLARAKCWDKAWSDKLDNYIMMIGGLPVNPKLHREMFGSHHTHHTLLERLLLTVNVQNVQCRRQTVEHALSLLNRKNVRVCMLNYSDMAHVFLTWAAYSTECQLVADCLERLGGGVLCEVNGDDLLLQYRSEFEHSMMWAGKMVSQALPSDMDSNDGSKLTLRVNVQRSLSLDQGSSLVSATLIVLNLSSWKGGQLIDPKKEVLIADIKPLSNSSSFDFYESCVVLATGTSSAHPLLDPIYERRKPRMFAKATLSYSTSSGKESDEVFLNIPDAFPIFTVFKSTIDEKLQDGMAKSVLKKNGSHRFEWKSRYVTTKPMPFVHTRPVACRSENIPTSSVIISGSGDDTWQAYANGAATSGKDQHQQSKRILLPSANHVTSCSDGESEHVIVDDLMMHTNYNQYVDMLAKCSAVGHEDGETIRKLISAELTVSDFLTYLWRDPFDFEQMIREQQRYRDVAQIDIASMAKGFCASFVYQFETALLIGENQLQGVKPTPRNARNTQLTLSTPNTTSTADFIYEIVNLLRWSITHHPDVAEKARQSLSSKVNAGSRFAVDVDRELQRTSSAITPGAGEALFSHQSVSTKEQWTESVTSVGNNSDAAQAIAVASTAKSTVVMATTPFSSLIREYVEYAKKTDRPNEFSRSSRFVGVDQGRWASVRDNCYVPSTPDSRRRQLNDGHDSSSQRQFSAPETPEKVRAEYFSKKREEFVTLVATQIQLAKENHIYRENSLIDHDCDLEHTVKRQIVGEIRMGHAKMELFRNSPEKLKRNTDKAEIDTNKKEDDDEDQENQLPLPQAKHKRK